MRVLPGCLSMWLLVACSAPPPAAPPAPAPTVPPATSPPPPLTASSPPPPAPTTPPPASASPPPTASAPPPPATYPTPTYPKKNQAFLPRHGEKAWAVYLATFEGPGSGFDAATSAWMKTGLPVASGEIGCDEGVRDKVKGAMGVRTYLRSESEARAFAREIRPEPVAIVQVKVMCAD